MDKWADAVIAYITMAQAGGPQTSIIAILSSVTLLGVIWLTIPLTARSVALVIYALRGKTPPPSGKEQKLAAVVETLTEQVRQRDHQLTELGRVVETMVAELVRSGAISAHVGAVMVETLRPYHSLAHAVDKAEIVTA